MKISIVKSNVTDKRFIFAGLLAFSLLTVSTIALRFVQRTQAVGELKIQYRYGDAANDTKIKPELKLVNTTTGSISLTNVKIRYWFTADDTAAPTVFCDFATVGCANLSQTIFGLNPTRPNADKYLEIGFASGAGSIAGGDNQSIKVRLQKATNYNDTNDYSFDAAKTAYADSTRITVYRAGTLVWGTEPRASGTPTPTPTPVGTVINVATASELTTALRNVQPGQTIQLADGNYRGVFVGTGNGTAASKITLRGSRNAILSNDGSTSKDYGFYLTANYWRLIGFTVTDSQKGIVLDGANNNLIDDVRVHNIGQEAVHFRVHSSNNTIQNSLITDTGKTDPRIGEGVYLGSSVTNWGDLTGGNPDRADNNQVLNNEFGPNITAEHIDIKEGTTGGTIRGNLFNGVGISGELSADSWVDVKGNNYTISDNIGNNTAGMSALLDGFQTHILYPGYGSNNVFSNNTANVNASGFGFRIQTSSSTHGSATGNIVYSNNTVTGASSGSASISLTPAP